MIDLSKKNIILTGSTGGIGNAILDKLYNYKANIIATGTNQEKLEKIKQKYKFKKKCPLSGKGAPIVDYKNIKLLKRYVSENGKILPSRITSVSQKKQRDLSLSIKRARNLALI